MKNDLAQQHIRWLDRAVKTPMISMPSKASNAATNAADEQQQQQLVPLYPMGDVSNRRLPRAPWYFATNSEVQGWKKAQTARLAAWRSQVETEAVQRAEAESANSANLQQTSVYVPDDGHSIRLYEKLMTRGFLPDRACGRVDAAMLVSNITGRALGEHGCIVDVEGIEQTRMQPVYEGEVAVPLLLLVIWRIVDDPELGIQSTAMDFFRSLLPDTDGSNEYGSAMGDPLGIGLHGGMLAGERANFFLTLIEQYIPWLMMAFADPLPVDHLPMRNGPELEVVGAMKALHALLEKYPANTPRMPVLGAGQYAGKHDLTRIPLSQLKEVVGLLASGFFPGTAALSGLSGAPASSPHDPMVGEESAISKSSKYLIVELLPYLAHIHAHRMRQLLSRTHVTKSLTRLLRYRDPYLVLSVIRFFRQALTGVGTASLVSLSRGAIGPGNSMSATAGIGPSADAVMGALMQDSHMAPLMAVFLLNVHKSNMINSALLDLFTQIAQKDGFRRLALTFAPQYGIIFRSLPYAFGMFTALIPGPRPGMPNRSILASGHGEFGGSMGNRPIATVGMGREIAPRPVNRPPGLLAGQRGGGVSLSLPTNPPGPTLIPSASKPLLPSFSQPQLYGAFSETSDEEADEEDFNSRASRTHRANSRDRVAASSAEDEYFESGDIGLDDSDDASMTSERSRETVDGNAHKTLQVQRLLNDEDDEYMAGGDDLAGSYRGGVSSAKAGASPKPLPKPFVTGTAGDAKLSPLSIPRPSPVKISPPTISPSLSMAAPVIARGIGLSSPDAEDDEFVFKDDLEDDTGRRAADSLASIAPRDSVSAAGSEEEGEFHDRRQLQPIVHDEDDDGAFFRYGSHFSQPHPQKSVIGIRLSVSSEVSEPTDTSASISARSTPSPSTSPSSSAGSQRSGSLVNANGIRAVSSPFAVNPLRASLGPLSSGSRGKLIVQLATQQTQEFEGGATAAAAKTTRPSTAPQVDAHSQPGSVSGVGDRRTSNSTTTSATAGSSTSSRSPTRGPAVDVQESSSTMVGDTDGDIEMSN
jgi:hypothetical protein